MTEKKGGKKKRVRKERRKPQILPRPNIQRGAVGQRGWKKNEKQGIKVSNSLRKR